MSKDGLGAFAASEGSPFTELMATRENNDKYGGTQIQSRNTA